MLKMTCAALSVALSVGCAASDGNGTDPLLMVGSDSGQEVDAFAFEPDPDDGVPGPDQGPSEPDVGALPQDFGRPEPDRGLPDPDMGEPQGLEGAIATVTVVEQPESAQIGVSISRFMETMPNEGDCQVVRVNPNQPVTPPDQLMAGPIVVEGARGGPFTFDFLRGAYVADRAIPDDVFSGGTMLRARAEGALPFDLQIPAPMDVALQNPGLFASVPSDSDLEVRWNAGGAEAALITVFPLSGFEPTTGDWVFCAASDSGTFRVPTADLRRASGPAFPGVPNALVAVTRIRTISRVVGTSQAILTATTSNGAAVTLE